MKIILVAILVFGVIVVSGCVGENIPGLANPASKYCEDQGGTVENREDPRAGGGQYGVCVLPEGRECDEWAFYRGGCETCLMHCMKSMHIQCTGYLEVTGEYPECDCKWICD